MSAVSNIKAVKVAPQEGMIKMLEDLLERAKAGGVREVAFVTLDADNSITTYVGPSNDCIRMLGALERLKIRFHDLNLEM
jgi:hypothetical protein